MLTNKDKNTILAMIKQAKDELRKEMWGEADNALENHNLNKQDMSDNTDAILELAEMIGGGE